MKVIFFSLYFVRKRHLKEQHSTLNIGTLQLYDQVSENTSLKQNKQILDYQQTREKPGAALQTNLQFIYSVSE